MAKGPADCRTSFVSAPIRQVRTPMANVTTAAQAATAPASAYKTPVLVGKRSRLSIPARRGGDQQNEAQDEDQDRH